MSTLPATHRPRLAWPDFAGWLSGLPSWAELRPVFHGHLMRLEDEMTDDCYRVRAELPDIDPGKDVDISVSDGQLIITAERNEKKESNGRSEFTYGSFTRTIALPVGAHEDDITATYDKGILTVSVPISESASSKKHIQVTAGSLASAESSNETSN